MIYLIGTTTRIKVGWSKNPYHRLRQLQTANSERLRLIKVYDVPRQKERFLHRQLFAFRERSNGEWFGLSATDAVDLCDNLLNHCYEFAKIS